jgi:DNA-binding MarR family transcriptional regulator
MQTRPVLIERNRCNCAALRKASRRLSQFYDRALAPSGLRATQFAVLSEITRRVDEAPTILDLAEALVMDPSTIGQNLRPLEREGLVTLQADARDRRRRNVAITDKGLACFALAQPLWRAAQEHFEESFGSEAARDLRASLRSIADDPTFAGAGERTALA